MQKRLEKKELRIYDFLFFLAKYIFGIRNGAICYISVYKLSMWKVVDCWESTPHAPGIYTPRRRTAIGVGATRHHPAIAPLADRS